MLTTRWAGNFNRGITAQTGDIPRGAQFLQETFPLEIKDIKQVISEATGTKQNVLRMTGVFQKGNELNQNGREYSTTILSEAVGALQEDLDRRVVMGEFDHPADAKIHLERVSHLITKVWMEGNYVYGEAEVIEGTTQGKNLSALLRAGVKVGISSRGVGDMEVVNEDSDSERYVVQPGYRFVTWDVVGEPSVQEATMSVMESRIQTRRSRSSIVTRANLRGSDPEYALLEELRRRLLS
jgi:hypothetical protein